MANSGMGESGAVNNMYARNPAPFELDSTGSDWDVVKSFILPGKGSRQFWCIKRRGGHVVVITGHEHDTGTEQNYEYGTEVEASNFLTDQVSRRHREGYLPWLLAVTRLVFIQTVIGDWFQEPEVQVQEIGARRRIVKRPSSTNAAERLAALRLRVAARASS